VVIQALSATFEKLERGKTTLQLRLRVRGKEVIHVRRDVKPFREQEGVHRGGIELAEERLAT
jgi:hypothetical protein